MPNILIESESHSQAQIDKAKQIISDSGGRVIIMPYFNDQSSPHIKSKILQNNIDQ